MKLNLKYTLLAVAALAMVGGVVAAGTSAIVGGEPVMVAAATSTKSATSYSSGNITGTGVTWTGNNVGGSSYVVLKSGASLTSNGFSDIDLTQTVSFTLKTRTYGGDTYKTSTVMAYSDVACTKSITKTAASVSATSKNLTNLTSTLTFENGAEATNVYFKITSPTTSTANGPGISEISFTYTTAVAKTVSSITITTAPSKTVYWEGESFDPTGLVIRADYSDSTNATIAYSDVPSSFTFSPSTSAALATTDNAVTVTFGGKSADQAITVNAVKPVSSVTLNKHELALNTGDVDSSLSAAVLPVDATYQDVTWTSSDNSVVSVDDSGVLTAVAAGSASVIAFSDTNGNGTWNEGELKDTCNVTVTDILVAGISLNESALSIPVGGSDTLVATVLPSDATDKTVTWTSSDTTVATVSNGSVTAKKQGTAIIKAMAAGYISDEATPDLFATCSVTVTDVVTVGKKYLLVSGTKVLTSVSTIGNVTGVNDFYLTTYALTLENGSSTGTYAFRDPDGKLLNWDSGNTLGLTSANATANAKSSWKITLANSVWTITNSSDSSRKLQYNSGSPRFACYSSNQTAPTLIEVDDYYEVGSFVESCMKMDQYAGDESYNETRCASNYAVAAPAYAALTASQKLVFATDTDFEDAKARFSNWAAANGDSFDETTGAYSQKNGLSIGALARGGASSSLPLVITILGVGAAAVTGFVLVSRKRKKA